MLPSICHADDVVLGSGTDGGRDDWEIQGGGTDSGSREDSLDKPAEERTQLYLGRRSVVDVGRDAGACWIDRVSRQEHETCDGSQNDSANKCQSKMTRCPSLLLDSETGATEHCEKDHVASVLVERKHVERRSKYGETKIASWSARVVANVTGSNRPPWMQMDQRWRLWHQTGHRWILKAKMNLCKALGERMLDCAGHHARLDRKDVCSEALRGRGLQWWRSSASFGNGRERVHTLNDSRSSDGKMECRQKRQNSSASQLDLQKM